jgi:hypothetical protein
VYDCEGYGGCCLRLEVRKNPKSRQERVQERSVAGARVKKTLDWVFIP